MKLRAPTLLPTGCPHAALAPAVASYHWQAEKEAAKEAEKASKEAEKERHKVRSTCSMLGIGSGGEPAARRPAASLTSAGSPFWRALAHLQVRSPPCIVVAVPAGSASGERSAGRLHLPPLQAEKEAAKEAEKAAKEAEKERAKVGTCGTHLCCCSAVECVWVDEPRSAGG